MYVQSLTLKAVGSFIFFQILQDEFVTLDKSDLKAFSE